MTSRNRTPTQLLPYLDLPPELSSTLLTGTLTCSTSWLTARFAALALGSLANKDGEQLSVVLVSWTKNEAFWRESLKRLGVDLRQHQPRFVCIDRLSEALHSPPRTPNDEINDIEKRVLSAVEQQAAKTSSKALVILDGPDVLLATHSTMDLMQLNRLLLRIRTNASVHGTVTSCFSGIPLISSEERITTPLETANAGFLLQQAHSARLVISLRELSTGSARDVTGIIRVTRGGAFDHDAETSSPPELEKRYLVQRDATVKIVE